MHPAYLGFHTFLTPLCAENALAKPFICNHIAISHDSTSMMMIMIQIHVYIVNVWILTVCMCVCAYFVYQILIQNSHFARIHFAQMSEL